MPCSASVAPRGTKDSRVNYLHDCAYGSPYLLGFRESIRFILFLRDA